MTGGMTSVYPGGFVGSCNEGERCQLISNDRQAVDGEKGVGRGEAHAFVAVHDRMVLRQALPSCTECHRLVAHSLGIA